MYSRGLATKLCGYPVVPSALQREQLLRCFRGFYAKVAEYVLKLEVRIFAYSCFGRRYGWSFGLQGWRNGLQQVGALS